jgi:4-hydroxybenzoate polyprenyltransferase
VAAGRLTKQGALLIGGVLGSVALTWAYMMHITLFWIMLAYTINNLVYSLILKHVVILDVMMIAVGFILRMLAGAVFITTSLSSWVFLCTFFLALFLGFAKRRGELSTLMAASASHRAVLNQYTQHMLDQMLTALMAITILCYSLYVCSDYAKERFHTDKLICTIPFVVYGIFRYFQQVQLNSKCEEPVEILLTDMHTLVNVLLWTIACILIIYM